MEALEPKICHYLNCESHIYLGVLRKSNAKREYPIASDHNIWTLRRVVTYLNCANANAKRQECDGCLCQKCFEYT